MRLTKYNAARLSAQFIDSIDEYPENSTGRGIVTCGGGIKYGGCAWILIKMLRYLGCQLPIEAWCLNDDEYDPEWVKLVEPLGVSCVNAADVLKTCPHRRLRGWELKPYAIKNSRFEEVLFLDADNVPVADPTYLFDIPEYRESGTAFWPDPEGFKTPADSPRWKVFGLSYRQSPDQESGQLLINKRRTWQAISLCNWYNEHSDFYYEHVYGDKETFRFAWQRLEQPISWMPFPTEDVLFTLVHYGPEGKSLFQHRFYRKWSLYGENTCIPGFRFEEMCLEWLAELREMWSPQKHLMRHVTGSDKTLMAKLVGQQFVYDRPGHNRWPMRLGNDSSIPEGFGPNEFFWWCEGGRLSLTGMDGKRKCLLRPASDGSWEGEYHDNRQTIVKLMRLANGEAR